MLALVSATILFTCFALICYVTYGDKTEPIFTMNLLPINGFTIFITFCVCFNAFCSYPVQILAAFEIIEEHPFYKDASPTQIKVRKVVSRSLIVCLITCMACLVPNFTDFLNIMGSLASSMIAFIIPSMLYLK